MAFRSCIHKRIRIVNHKRIDIRIRIQHANSKASKCKTKRTTARLFAPKPPTTIWTPRCKTKRTTPRLFAPQATNNHLGI